MRYTIWKDMSNSTPIILWTVKLRAKTIRAIMDRTMLIDFIKARLLVRMSLLPLEVMLNVSLALGCT